MVISANPSETFRNGIILLRRLLRDRAGNTVMIAAAAMIPLLAILGGGIDMGRSYLSQARLQQACDAGVLAARKRIGSSTPVGSLLPADSEKVGQRFFNFNFRNGAYGSQNRTFAMTLEPDMAVSGVARVDVPTTVMQIFGHDNVPLTVNCAAKLNFSNTDIMMVLDTTYSMVQVNPGDSISRIDGLRSVVKAFHGQLEAAKAPGNRIRYGFVPYSQSVNVGNLLKPDWMVDNWSYNGRMQHDTGRTRSVMQYDYQYSYISGSAGNQAMYTGTSCPADTMTWKVIAYSVGGDGSKTWRYLEQGTSYDCTMTETGTYEITPYVASNHLYDWKQIRLGPREVKIYDWKYDSYPFDVSIIKDRATDRIRFAKFTVPMGGTADAPTGIDAVFRGCIEERDTYEIGDYANVDLGRALDLDIDRVPTAGDPATQWRPVFDNISWARANPVTWKYSKAPVYSPLTMDFGYSFCPSPARKLGEMNAAQVASYVDALVPDGNTHHDIGMLWGGRLLSPTGLFATENADVDGKPTSRHLIFMTDGYTTAYESFYNTHGIEAVDQRRWTPSSTQSLNQVVESRFLFACDEVKKRNITIWVIGFGIDLNPVLTKCAGPGRAFSAKNTTELSETFSRIATAIGDLRISK